MTNTTPTANPDNQWYTASRRRTSSNASASESASMSPTRTPCLRHAAINVRARSRDVVVTVYNAAGATAIFNENPFERRLRDIHAGTQQGQGRPIHFETVGQILMGLPPEGRMFR